MKKETTTGQDIVLDQLTIEKRKKAYQEKQSKTMRESYDDMPMELKNRHTDNAEGETKLKKSIERMNIIVIIIAIVIILVLVALWFAFETIIPLIVAAVCLPFVIGAVRAIMKKDREDIFDDAYASAANQIKDSVNKEKNK